MEQKAFLKWALYLVFVYFLLYTIISIVLLIILVTFFRLHRASLILYIIIIVATFLIVALGYYGIRTEKRRYLLSYIIAMIVLSIAILTNYILINLALRRAYKNHLKLEEIRPVELQLHCCGINSFRDYTEKSMPVPSSCCGQKNKNAECLPKVYTKTLGCHYIIDILWHFFTIPYSIMTMLNFVCVILVLLLSGTLFHVLLEERRAILL